MPGAMDQSWSIEMVQQVGKYLGFPDSANKKFQMLQGIWTKNYYLTEIQI